MRDAVLQALKIRPGEVHKTLLLTAYLFLAVATFIAGRIVRDSLFLSSFQKEDLAWMYISVAVMVPVPALLFSRIADRFRRDRLLLGTLAVIVLGMAACRVLLEAHSRWVYVVLYNFVEVYGTFLLLQFWTFAGDLFSSREAKRLYPVIGAGSILAGIVCGVVVSALVKVIGTENLLVVQMAMLVCAAVVVWRIGRLERGRLEELVAARHQRKGSARASASHDVREVFGSNHLRIIAGMTVATFVTVPLIDYQFKVLTKEFFTTAGIVDTDGLASFMGLFSTTTGVVAAVTQFAITGRVLERWGVVASLLLLPIFLLLGGVGMIVGLGSQLVCAIFTKGAENAFRYSIYDATMQVLYTPVASTLRGRAKTFIDGIVKPVAGGVAGAAMVLLIGPLKLPVASLAGVATLLTSAWIVLILLIRREYVLELLGSLRRRRLDFSHVLVITDAPTVEVLRKRLTSSDAGEVRNAVELARRVQGHDLSDVVVPLLRSSDSELRVRAVDILEKTGAFAAATELEALFDDPNHDVRAAAVRAYSRLVGEPALRVVQRHLQSDAPSVRGAAVASMIRHGGLEGILTAADDLKDMLGSSNEGMRYAAAGVLREIAVKSFYQPVLALMRDPSPRVQNAAIAAAGVMTSSELVPALVYKLQARDTGRAAAQALACYGDAVVDVLGKVLAQPREEPAVRRQVPRILERVGTPRALQILVGHLEVEDPDTRKEVARAIARVRDRLDAPIDAARVRRLIAEELREHYQHLAAIADLKDVADDPRRDLLRDAIEERLERNLDRVFRLMSIIYPLKAIETIHANLRGAAANARANAIEVLDNLLDGDMKKRILPLIEEQARERVLERGVELYTLQRKAPEQWIRDYLLGRDPWLVVCALHVAAELGLRSLVDDVEPHLRHADPIVRETALRALVALRPDADARAAVEEAVDDDAIVVKRTARDLLARLGSSGEEAAMLDDVASARAAPGPGVRP